MVKHQILLKLKKDPVLAVSLVLAVVSAFWVRPSAAYLGYIDWRVLALLAALMLAVAALGQAGLFDAVTAALLRRMRDTRRLAAGTARQIGLVLVLLCFFSSMVVTNDVALITFVPLTLMLTAQTGTERFNIPIIALQTVAANLGSAMTPLGNPQNLYLYSLSGMGLGEFLRLMAPVTGLSLVLLSAAVLCLPCRPLGAADIRLNRPDRRGLLLWGAVFAVCLLSVLRVLHYGIALGAAVLAALLADRRLLRRVDYSLLLTFLFFFVFVGNMKVLPTVSEALSGLVAGREMTVGILLSQVISNVPAAMLLSGFTADYPALLLGVNLGGLGTLIASMASLISYKLYAAADGARTGKYMLFFTAVNVVLLAVLWGAMVIIYK